jgi:hypothetical protein
VVVTGQSVTVVYVTTVVVVSLGGSSGETPVGVGVPAGGAAVHLLQTVAVEVIVTVETVL